MSRYHSDQFTTNDALIDTGACIVNVGLDEKGGQCIIVFCDHVCPVPGLAMDAFTAEELYPTQSSLVLRCVPPRIDFDVNFWIYGIEWFLYGAFGCAIR